MLRLISRRSARDDAAAIFNYIADRNVAAAERLQAAIELCAEAWAERPFMYRPGRVEGTRAAVVHPNYILVYRVTADAVEIVNVVHARRDYP